VATILYLDRERRSVEAAPHFEESAQLVSVLDRIRVCFSGCELEIGKPVALKAARLREG
jgi:hypothetical protein